MRKVVWSREFRRFRKKHKLTKEQFARAMNVTVRTVNNWESGFRVPYARKIEEFRALIQRYATAAAMEDYARGQTTTSTS